MALDVFDREPLPAAHRFWATRASWSIRIPPAVTPRYWARERRRAKLDLLSDDARPDHSFWRRWQLWGPLALIALLLLVAIVLPLWQKRAYTLALLQVTGEARVQAEASSALRTQLEQQAADYNFALGKKYAYPSAVQVLDDVTKLMPDDTWITQFEVKSATKGKEPYREMMLKGESANAGQLVSLLEDSHEFVDAAPRSPTMKIQPGPGEIFDFSARVKPLPAPAPIEIATATQPRDAARAADGAAPPADAATAAPAAADSANRRAPANAAPAAANTPPGAPPAAPAGHGRSAAGRRRRSTRDGERDGACCDRRSAAASRSGPRGDPQRPADDAVRTAAAARRRAPEVPLTRRGPAPRRRSERQRRHRPPSRRAAAHAGARAAGARRAHRARDRAGPDPASCTSTTTTRSIR